MSDRDDAQCDGLPWDRSDADPLRDMQAVRDVAPRLQPMIHRIAPNLYVTSTEPADLERALGVGQR